MILRRAVDRLLGRGMDIALLVYTVFVFIFLIAPILFVVVISFSPVSYVSFPIPGVSLRWFRYVFEYTPFVDSMIVTIQVAFLSSMIAGVLGVAAAIALVRIRAGWAAVTLTFLLAPLSIPWIVLGFALLFYLSAIGLGVSMTSLLIGHTVVSLPYIVRTVAAVYRGLPENFEEIAMVLGATKLQTFYHVTLPLIRPGIFAGVLFSILNSIDNLPISYFFGSPSTSTLPVVMLSYLESEFDPSIAALTTIKLVFAIFSLLLVERFYGLRTITPSS